MLRTPLISAAILAALGWAAPSGAGGLVASRVIERGVASPGAVVRGRVQDASGTPGGAHVAAFTDEGEVAVVDVYFGMAPQRDDAATQGFVPAAGRAARSEVRISRGPRPAGAVCLPEDEPGGVAAEALGPVRLR